ncbi:YchJ family protein [Micromonospora echinofusca]|nr:YchJ family protein [Micromonospora echinofusca]
MAKRNVRRTDDPARPCPCGHGPAYRECCGPLHRGATSAPTAEALMRSRFSAYAVGDTAHLLRTWHPTGRPARLTLDAQQRWTRLEILDTDRGGLFDTAGTVEFRAHYRDRGQPGMLHERSRFARLDGQWVYVDGTLSD